MIAGRSATTASSSRAVGKRRSFHSTWFQPRPMTQRAFGFAAMCLRIRPQRIVDARRVAQVCLQLLLAETEHVTVRIGEAGQHVLAAAVDDSSRQRFARHDPDHADEQT